MSSSRNIRANIRANRRGQGSGNRQQDLNDVEKFELIMDNIINTGYNNEQLELLEEKLDLMHQIEEAKKQNKRLKRHFSSILLKKSKSKSAKKPRRKSKAKGW